MTLTLYGASASGNCLKVKWTCDHLSRPYRWVEVDVVGGGARSAEMRAFNPAAQVPIIVLPDGRPLAQSNAIVAYLAEDTALTPADAFDRAKMFEWMFWEQYSHEPYIAVRRFQKAYLGMADAELDPKLLERGEAALALMEARLARSAYLVADAPTCADVSLLAYTRVAHEGGFDLAPFPSVRAWVTRVCADLKVDASPPDTRARQGGA